MNTDTIWATLAETGRVRVAIPEGCDSQWVRDQLHGEAQVEGVSLRINSIFCSDNHFDVVVAVDVALRKFCQ
jgi:hypothetical protein